MKAMIKRALLSRKIGVKRLNEREQAHATFLAACQNVDQATYKINGMSIKAPAIGGRFTCLIDEIFEKEIYHFIADSDRPVCIDAGANVGCATLYWKWLYPEAKVICLEPDFGLFELLKKKCLSQSNFWSRSSQQSAVD